MAINKNKSKQLIEDIDSLFAEVASKLSEDQRQAVKKLVLGPAIDDIRALVNESRPPVFMLIGRSRHGKSSLINALANKEVAKVDPLRPCTFEPTRYEIVFDERHASWTVIDTRGIFDSVTPQGAQMEDAIEQLKGDITKYKPDIIIHVISANELGACRPDLQAFSTIHKVAGVETPVIVVLSHVDTLGNPRQWPPEKAPEKAGLIQNALDFAKEVLKITDSRPIDLNVPIRGFTCNSRPYAAVVPVCARTLDDQWNLDILANYIATKLPIEAVLDLSQVPKNKNELKRLSTSIIKRFSVIAGGIGASPLPIADIAILTPLQLLLVAIIGGLSCREFSKATAVEYLGAAGVNIGLAVGFRTLAQQAIKYIPIVGPILSGAIAGSATYGIGKAAEKYFFDEEVLPPESFSKMWDQDETLID